MGDFTWDVETGEVTWSDGLFDLLGYDTSDRIDYARVNAEIHHPDDLKRVTQWLNNCIASGDAELTPNEYRLIRKDGEIITIRAVGIIEREDGGSAKVFATVQDITELHRAREEARRTLHFLEFAIEQIPIPVIIAEAPDVAISYFNRGAVNLLTKVPGDVKEIPLDAHREFWPTFYPDGTPYRVEDLPLTRAIQRGDVTHGAEIIVRREDGDHWISASAAPLRDEEGRIIAGIVAFPEITERKRAEADIVRASEALREHREHLEELVAERTADLRKMVNAMAGREVRMAELKGVIRELRAQLEEAGLEPVANDPLLGS